MFMELCSKWLDTVGKRRFPLMSVHEEVMVQEFAAWLNKQDAEHKLATNETSRLRELLWVGVLCGACGHSYKYNRADDPKGEKGHEEHLVTYPDCPSSRH